MIFCRRVAATTETREKGREQWEAVAVVVVGHKQASTPRPCDDTTRRRRRMGNAATDKVLGERERDRESEEVSHTFMCTLNWNVSVCVSYIQPNVPVFLCVCGVSICCLLASLPVCVIAALNALVAACSVLACYKVVLVSFFFIYTKPTKLTLKHSIIIILLIILLLLLLISFI